MLGMILGVSACQPSVLPPPPTGSKSVAHSGAREGSSLESLLLSPPPGIRITVDPSAQIREGASANLTCLVASWAVGEMNYTWYKNGNQLQDGPGQSLLLQDATKDDAGMYHCQVGSGAGSVTSTPVMLNVLCKCCQGART